MSLELLPKIYAADTLAELREKINAISTRVDDGEFTNITVYNDVDIQGVLRVQKLVEVESEQQQIPTPVIVLSYEDPPPEVNDGLERGVAYLYVEGTTPKVGFFGRDNATGDFTYIPDATVTGSNFSGTPGTIRAKIEASDILNAGNLAPVFSSAFVAASDATNFYGTKTFNNTVLLTDINQGTAPTHALPASRALITGDGIIIDSTDGTFDLTEDRTISVDETVVRTSGDQLISGNKTFESLTLLDVGGPGLTINVEGVVSTTSDQSIFGEKVFRPNELNDGIRVFGREGGSGDYFVSLNTTTLSGNRAVTFADSNSTLTAGTMVSLENAQTITSEKTFSQNILFSDSGTTKRGVHGTVGTNDYWFFGGSASAANTGHVEIASGDEGNEPIFVRQYSGSPLSGLVSRELVLLSTDGATHIPGSLVLGVSGTGTTHAVRADRTISTGDGLTGGGNLTANRTIAVNASVLRTTGNFTVSGDFIFSGSASFTNTIAGNAATATKFQSPVNINGTAFDGSSDITIATVGEMPTGGGTNKAFYEADIVISEDYTITAGRNALSIGPIEILPGVTVTVPSGSTWVVVGTE